MASWEGVNPLSPRGMQAGQSPKGCCGGGSVGQGDLENLTLLGAKPLPRAENSEMSQILSLPQGASIWGVDRPNSNNLRQNWE